MFKRIQHIHFVGIGGVGMSGIAEVLLNLGYKVSGSDIKLSPVTERLAGLGGQIFEGHRAENICGADVVVISSAVKMDNPEVVAANSHQIPVIPRAEMLAELMRLKYGIAVAGAHGKTSTTSMIGHMLNFAGLDPTIVVGGRVGALGSNAKLGRGEFMVVEADESDGSFLKLSPAIAVVTNIDREHLDYYGSLEELCNHFANFANKVPFYGSIVLCLDDTNAQSIIPQIKRRLITYGLQSQSDVLATAVEMTANFGSRFEVKFQGRRCGMVELHVPGMHSVYNALASIAVGLDLEIEFSTIAEALAEFRGVDRRFQIKGELAGVLVVDDYGHHPAEIRATLRAAQAAGRRVVVVFQPHRYSRTSLLMNDFARSFYDANVVRICDIYPAGEEPIEGVSSRNLALLIERYGHKDVKYVGSLAEAVAAVRQLLQPGDLLLTLGAGNVWQVGEELLKGA
ncbi:MAG: UDP-N-acetylmuramate--L-alanine ligase [Acidobacteriota bacterium]|nr:UDP-N-acetylmuramate--L-alanine ligase [Blastocatellia bacterium]MDW8412261.1 UDP-N-acetylmuramate--L-alanine ligase [Acidobacteriota bacterium]